MSNLSERLNGSGPKRILALDGGGIRGALALGYLEQIEELLKERSSDPNAFRLRDYFDLIAGTSTGSIIASALAIGKTVKEVQEKYLEMGQIIFGKRNFSFAPGKARYLTLKAQYDHRPLEEALKDFFGDIRIGDQDAITTGLCIVSKRADTFSTWPIHNNPDGKYYRRKKGSKYWGNEEYLIRDLVRASSAAPTFFEHKQLPVTDDRNGYFIDGGVSLANNPAFQALLLTQLKGFRLNWPLEAGKLALTSVGTGSTPNTMDPNEVRDMKMIGWAEKIPDLFMQDANYFNQALLQWLSNSPTSEVIDSEVGDLHDDELAGAPLHYIRYNMELRDEPLRELKPEGYGDHEALKRLREMDRAENCPILLDIGQRAARHPKRGVKAAHFPEHFDPTYD